MERIRERDMEGWGRVLGDREGVRDMERCGKISLKEMEPQKHVRKRSDHPSGDLDGRSASDDGQCTDCPHTYRWCRTL